MKPKQETLFDMTEERKRKQAEQYKRAKWYKAFQARSDELAQDETTPKGKCGYMDICDFCADCGETNPCVKAFRKYAKARNITINFDDLKSIEEFF